MISSTAAPDAPLPRLRDELQLLPGGADPEGAPTWLIFDPAAHRYLQIDIEAYQLLSAWGRSRTIADLCRLAAAESQRSIGAADISALVRFLDGNGLLEDTSGGWRGFAHRAQTSEPGWVMWLVHNYLFIRVPLFRPADFLKATLPCVEPLYTRRAALLLVAVTFAGLYLVSRQWQAFVGTFQHFFNLQGAAVFLLALAGVKVCHELGHAYTATRFGCRVSSMGVALLVMMPMLYTDVTDAWRIKSRHQRMAIDAAGIIVELALAGLATFAWAFLPDGPARSVAFVLATTSWVTSIAVNLSPLMRFDGYFLFADFVGINNLQPRANTLGCWQLRRTLLGLAEPCPERLPAKTLRWLIGYAWLIWAYRLVVFFGIALAVYHYFFKLLGIILFAVEIVWFILKPIAFEAVHWWRSRAQVTRAPRAYLTGTLVIGGLISLFIPWSSDISVPAIMEPAGYTRLYPPAPARIAAIHVTANQRVTSGDLLVELEAPRLQHQVQLNEIKIGLLEARLRRGIADHRDRLESISIGRELATLRERRAGFEREREQLRIRAPATGRLAELSPELHVGRWIGRETEIGLVVADGPTIVRGYLRQDDLWRVAVGASGRFTFEDPRHRRERVVVTGVDVSGIAAVEILYLASTYGGPVAVREDRERGLVPTDGIYQVTMRTIGRDLPIAHVARGSALLVGQSESVIAAAARQVLKVLIRESGF